MFELETVLAPTDLTEGSRSALPFAAHLAAAFDAELHLLYVNELHSDPTRARELPSSEEVQASLDAEVGTLLERLEATGGGELRTQTVERRAVEAAPAIVEYADEIGADLIVMGTHGRRGLGRLFLGSVTDTVLRHTRCPVLTVRDEVEISPSAEGRILAAIDLDATSERVIEAATRFSAWSGAEVELLHVVELPHHPVVYEAFPELPEIGFDELESEAKSRLESICSASTLDPERSRCTVKVGSPAEVILEEIGADKPDLVVVASHTRGGLDRALLGSVAERIVQRSSSPVLVLPGGAEDE